MLRAAIFGPESSVIDGRTRNGRRPPFSNGSDELSRYDEHTMKRPMRDRRRRSVAVTSTSCTRLLSNNNVERSLSRPVSSKSSRNVLLYNARQLCDRSWAEIIENCNYSH